ncbi:hypothetical protein EDF88_4173 [Buttiauxella sp. BIGb0552]|uniref:DUF2570 domain-containing protein n=1 Tax=Buttiauxella sp. BIGb0552 TaxID=2485120 RepID=UPI0010D3463A|nr:DUF2570 domain-containing protein [Buttiauxella sp. BIGb0552]TDX14846.1 hypothetical protein EDF88_4173 [Buttiauxella sp. BIGb0552]
MITYFLLSLKTHWRWWLSIAALVVIAWLWNENTRIDASLTTLEGENNSNRAVMDNMLRTVAITNIVLGVNQHAKNQIALESQRAASDIKAAVAGDDCAARVVPAGAANRLRQYADSVRASASATNPSQPDR